MSLSLPPSKSIVTHQSQTNLFQIHHLAAGGTKCALTAQIIIARPLHTKCLLVNRPKKRKRIQRTCQPLLLFMITVRTLTTVTFDAQT